MLEFNMIYAMLVGAALILLIRFIFPLYRDRASIYKDVKQALLLFGYAFRDEKIKGVADTIFNIVSIIEKYDKDSLSKQYQAMASAYDELLKEFDITLDDEVIELLVDIAVSYLPPTNADQG